MIFNFGQKYKKLSENNQRQEQAVKNLRTEVAELNSSILYWTEKQEAFRGTKYDTYDSQISIANSMYNGTAAWGVNQMGAVLGSRVGFIMPKGFKVFPVIEGMNNIDNEINFAKNFIAFNGLAKENVLHFLEEGELEGKILFKLFFDTTTLYIPVGEEKPAKGMTSVRYISQVSNPYSVKVNPNDYMMIESATYRQGGKDETVNEPELIYRKFGGRLDQINETSSKVLKVLTQIENLDRCLRDLREINHMFAAPILHCQTDNAEDAIKQSEAADRSNLKIGRMSFHTGVLGYAQPTMTGVDSLYKEIVVLAEMIAFNTGVPVHYWFPELATNRATAEDISYGLINSATSSERTIWEGLLEEMINKAIAIYNSKAKMTQLRQGVLKVKIPVFTEKDWERLTGFWMTLWSQKGITLRTLLNMIPEDIDVEKEIGELEAAKDEAFDKMRANGLFDNKTDEEDKDVGNKNGNKDQKETSLQAQK